MKNTIIQKSLMGIISVIALIASHLFFTNTLYAQSTNITWAISAGGIWDEYGFGVASDGLGNVVITGKFSRTANFGAITLIGVDEGNDIFIAKYDPLGNAVWARRAGQDGNTDDCGRDIATDEQGNIFVTGNFVKTSYVPPNDDSIYAIFVAKYDAAGNVLWDKQVENKGRGYSIATDVSGNSLVTGYFSGTVTFGTISMNSAGSSDIFVVKYNSSGDVLWARQAGGADSDYGYGIATDEQGNIFITGYFQDTANFGATTLNSDGTPDILLVAKYDASGNALWAKQAGGIVTGIGIATDGSGNAIVTGYFQATATFGATTLTSEGTSDVFVTKFDASGNVLWARCAGGIGSDVGHNIDTDGSGNSVIFGEFQNTVTFGDITLISASLYDNFIAKYDEAGNVLWVRKISCSNFVYGQGDVATDGQDNIIVTGAFQGMANIGPTKLTCSDAGDWEIFIAKYDATGDIGDPVPIEMTTFMATAGNGIVTLNWITQSETENLGFHIYRSLNEKGDYAHINKEIIQGVGTSSRAHNYNYTDSNIQPGNTYYYKLADVDFNGNITFHGPISVTFEELPKTCDLAQNFPNPFNATSIIGFVLPEKAEIKISVYDVMGKEVEVIADGEYEAGNHEIYFNATNLTSGLYFYKLETNDFVDVKKMAVLK